MNTKTKFATVDQVIELLKEQSKMGRGDCNNEYMFARPDEKPEITEQHKTVSYGGYYCGD